MIRLLPRTENLKVALDLTSDLRADQQAASRVLDVFASAHPALKPDSIVIGDGTAVFSAEAAAAAWAASKDREVYLSRADDSGLTHWASIGTGKKRTSRLRFSMPLAPFASADLCSALTGAIVKIASDHPCRYGFAHMSWDADLGDDAPDDRPAIMEMYWLNVLGAELVKKLGAARVQSTPAHQIDALPDGSVVIVTTPTPTAYFTAETAEARARALYHLRQDLKLGAIEKRYAERAAALAPVERDWDPDIARLLEYTLKMEPLDKIRAREHAYNALRPTVTEWVPAAEAPQPDVEASVAANEIAGHVESLYLIAQAKLDLDESDQPEWLEKLDVLFWQGAHKYFATPETIEKVILPIGAYLGEMLVDHLDGRWVYRKTLGESAVIVGDRAWLPFVRARNFAASKQSVLDASLMKFFREAERQARNRSE